MMNYKTCAISSIPCFLFFAVVVVEVVYIFLFSFVGVDVPSSTEKQTRCLAEIHRVHLRINFSRKNENEIRTEKK